jgi:hypothetical protein
MPSISEMRFIYNLVVFKNEHKMKQKKIGL